MVAWQEQEGQKCRKDTRIAEIDYDPLVAHSAVRWAPAHNTQAT